MIDEIVKKVIESEPIQNIIKDVSDMKGQINKLTKDVQDINTRILGLELKVDRLEKAINNLINKDSSKNIVANRYLNADYSNSVKKNEMIANPKINNYEIFLTNPNNRKVTKDTNYKRLKRYDSSIFINPNVKPVTIPKKSNTKLIQKNNSYLNMLTDRNKNLKISQKKYSVIKLKKKDN